MSAQPTLRQLRFLTALSHRLHFGKAADDCFVTQSTLSSGIKELEELLGAQLVERTKRSVRMTALGQAIAEQATAILQATDLLVRTADQQSKPFAAAITLGAIPTIGPYVLPKMLKATKKKYPSLKLYLREEQTAPLLQRLHNGDIDLALLAFPYDVAEGIETFMLCDDPFDFVCATDHALAGAGPIERKLLQGEDLLLLEEGHCLRDHALGVCQLRTAQKARSNVFQATSLTTLVQMVEAGLGTTLVPRLAVKAGSIDRKALCVRPVQGGRAASSTDGGLGRTIGLAWRKTSHRAEEYRALAQLLRSVLG